VTGYTGAAGQLTRRQRQVLNLVKAGLKRREIAERLGISPETVKAHVANIATRIDARTQQQAATAARRAGEQP
jgi:DNA-binding CsgD family transcriptional regulator